MTTFNSFLTLNHLPPPPLQKTGWPWNEQNPIPVYNPKLSYPKISIITPSYNYGKFIEETIRSVLLQGYPNLEYIIIDGGSTDNTVEIIKKYEQYLTFWDSQPDKGQTDAINRGHNLCTGEIFAWINADDAYAIPTCLQQVAELYLKGYQFIVGDCTKIFTDSQNKIIKKELKTSIPTNFKQYLKFWVTPSLPQPSVFIAEEIAQHAFPLGTDIYGAMDYQFFLRSLRQNPRSIWIKESWVNYLKHGTNKTMGNQNLGNLKVTDDGDSGFKEFSNIASSEALKISWFSKIKFQTDLKNYTLLYPWIGNTINFDFFKIMSLLFQRPTLIYWPLFWKILGKSLLGEYQYSTLKRKLLFLKCR